MSARLMSYLASHPSLAARYRATGKLPRTIRPRSPLIELLERIAPRDRFAMLGMTVDSTLGYKGQRTFNSAEAALRWVRPAVEMIEGEAWPAESWRMREFSGPLYLEDLLAVTSRVPHGIQERHPALLAPAGLRRPAPRTPRQDVEPPAVGQRCCCSVAGRLDGRSRRVGDGRHGPWRPGASPANACRRASGAGAAGHRPVRRGVDPGRPG